MPTDNCAGEKKAYDRAVKDTQEAERKRKTALKKMLNDTQTYITGGAIGAEGVAVSAWESNPRKAAAKVAVAAASWIFSLSTNGDRVDADREEYETRCKDLEEAWNAQGRALIALVNCQNREKKTGCGSRGGPGNRRPDGKCAGYGDWKSHHG